LILPEFFLVVNLQHYPLKMPGARGPVPVNRDLPSEILTLLAEKDGFATEDAFPNIPRPEVKAAVDRLASRDMVEYDTKEKEVVLLTEESERICDEGSHEYKVWDAVRRKGKISIKELPVSIMFPIGMVKLLIYWTE
jgi:phenylalanyl-tRNA synthetase alpha chain